MSEDLSPYTLLGELVALPGPPGQEDRVREYVAGKLGGLGLPHRIDAKGNLITAASDAIPERPSVVVTAHLDEIALMVSAIETDGALRVAPLGGVYPWKWGEGPVDILARGGTVPGVLSFGSIHSTSPLSVAEQARNGAALTWSSARVLTGRRPQSLLASGVRPGTRIVLAPSRRTIADLGGQLVASYFLDDRADLVAWLLALRALKGEPGMENVAFVATAAEEVGGEGALYLLQEWRPAICVALEIGPDTPDAPVALTSDPTVWVSDSYAATDPRDLDILEDVARDEGLAIQWQALSRGGSDASCSASRGLCARPVTLAFAAANSHGFEIMHRDAPTGLARLLAAYLRIVARREGKAQGNG